VIKNGLYNAAGGIVRIGLALVSVPALIRLIGLEDYGVWTLASSVIGIAILAEGGISVSTTYFLSKDITNDDRIGISETLTATFTAMLFMATIAAIFFYLGSDFFIFLFHKLKEEQYIQILIALKIGSLVLWVRLLQQQLVGLMQAYEKYSLINILSTIQSSIGILGLIAVAALGGRIIEMMEWQVFQSIVGLVAHLIVSKKLVNYARPHFKWNGLKSKEIFKYSSVAWTGSLGSALFTQGDRLIVGSYLDFKGLGIYAAIASIVSQINALSALPISPLLPSITKYNMPKGKNNIREIEKRLKQGLELNALVAFSLGAFIIVMANEIATIIIGKDLTEDSTYALQIASMIYSMYSLNAVGYYILYALSEVKICTAINLASAVISLILIAGLSTKFSLLGAVLGNSGYILTILMTIISLKILNMKIMFLIKCLSFPFTWFVSTTWINLALDNVNAVIRVFLYLFEFLIMISWFVKSNPMKKGLQEE
jgi:O-antigen/teichoic acid export membrane protein